MGVRIFIYDGKEIDDPDPTMSTEEVRQFLANSFAELFNAETRKTKRGDDEVYTFVKRVGTKGAVIDSGTRARVRLEYDEAIGEFLIALDRIDKQYGTFGRVRVTDADIATYGNPHSRLRTGELTEIIIP